MPCSMTGYAKNSFEFREQLITMELQSVNHRYRDFQVHLPCPSFELERLFRSWLEGDVARGKVSLNIRGDLSNKSGNVKLMDSEVEKYVRSSIAIKESFALSNPPGLAQLFSLPGVVTLEEDDGWIQEFQQAVRKPFLALIKEFNECRMLEGKVLTESILAYSQLIRQSLGKITAWRDGILAANVEKLRTKIDLLIDQQMDQARLHMEAAVLVEKMDVEEELVRMRAHLDSLDQVLVQEGECGKKLNFLCQEIHREINTIGSKSGDLKIIQEVIESKSNLEKIREQIQNLE